jgi:acetylornithine deacetylase/succinyl-diaminopimelate desuccinylase-like protein
MLDGMITLALLLLAAEAGLPAKAGQAARAWRQAHQQQILADFMELLAIPNVAADLPNIRRNAAWISRYLEKRRIQTRLLEIEGAPPVVYGERRTAGARTTVVFYVHYDGQPVEPRMWTNQDPFKPEIRDGHIWARSASDDKAPIIALMAALDALDAAGIAPTVNLKFFFEGEEEAGSRRLAQYLAKHKDLLAADLWIFCDGPVHQNRQQQIVFGARGVTGLEITVYGAKRELHSGHYGNWAPNPAMLLAQLLGSMKDANGRVLVKDFYQGVLPLSESEKRALAAVPRFDQQLQDELWLARTEGERLDEMIQAPSLNIRGLASASVGAQSRNVIPERATASLDIRLVKGVDHRVAVNRVIEHIRAQGYFVTDQEPGAATRRAHPRVARVVSAGGYNAARTPMDLEISQRLIRAVEQARGPVVKMPSLGGSLPLFVFEEILKTPFIVVPIANHDNNQHGHNENLRLENLWDGIETMAALLVM